MKYTIMWIVVLLLQPVFSHAAIQGRMPLNFEYFRTADGLSQNDVTCIAQDSLGFIWLGTRNGLNKYDGYKFVCYKHETHNPASLSNSIITSLHVATDGKVWIGTIDGLNIYDPHTDQFQRIYDDGGGMQLFRNSSVAFIRTLSDGELWLGAGSVLCRRMNDGNRFISYSFSYERNILNRLTRINCLLEDQHGSLWVGDSYGLHLFDRQRELFRQVYPRQESNYRSFKVHYLLESPTDNVLYMGTSAGLFAFDTVNLSSEEIRYRGKSLGVILQLETDRQGVLWIATQDNGLFRLSQDELSHYKYNPTQKRPLPGNQLTSLFIDNSNNLWAGTRQKGVIKASLDEPEYRLLSYSPADSHGLNDNTISAVLTEDSVIWVGAEYGVLSKIYKDSGRVNRYELTIAGADAPFGVRRITAIKRDESNRLWISSGNGLHYFDERSERFIRVDVRFDRNNNNHLYRQTINSITIDDKGNLWCAFPLGTFILLKSEIGVDPYYVKTPGALISKHSQVVYQDKRAEMWIGTQSSGLIKYTGNILKHSFEHYGVDGQLFNSNNISALFEDSRNHFWVGTWGGGLHLFNRDTREVTSYTVSDGLLDNTVFSISEDSQGVLWIGTYGGLTSFDVESGRFEHHQFRNSKEVFEINYGAYDMGTDNTIYLGTNEGVIVYHPGRVHEKLQHNRIIFTSLMVNGQEVRINDVTDRSTPIISESINTTSNITLSYKDKHFSIGFTNFNNQYTYTDRFAYKLEGFDTGWMSSSQNRISYTNLSSRKYVLLVQNIDRNGQPTGNVSRLIVDIRPPFWKTVYAYLLYAALIITLLWAFYLYVLKRAQQKQKLIQEEAERELYQAKMRFFTNISHEIRSPLTLILGPIDRIRQALRHDEKLSKQVEIMARNGDRLLRMVNQLLNLRKIEMGEMKVSPKPIEFVSFVRKVCAYFEDACVQNGLSMNIHSVPVRLECEIDEDKVEKILYNLLSNAVKYTKSYIEVFVDVDTGNKAQENILIRVRDNGPGIDEADKERIFNRFFQTREDGNEQQGTGIGLHLAREFAGVMGGSISVRSEKHNGAEFTVLIPYCRVSQPPEEVEKATDEDLAEEAATAGSNRPVVLVVEDSEDIRIYLNTVLDEFYEVRHARNGQEGEDMATELLPDIIICDIMMPVKNGIEMNIALKNNILTRHIPIVMLTAKTADEIKKESFEAGADAYITKPFSEKVLKAQLNRILSSKEEVRKHLLSELLMTPQKIKETTPENEFIGKAVAIVEKNYTDPEFDVAQLSQELAMSRVHLYRTFRSFVGRSPSDFIKDFRLQRAVDILLQRKYNINEIAYMTGFNDPKYFTGNFKKKYGMTPSEYLRKN